MYTINDFNENDFVMVDGQYADIIEVDPQDDSLWIRYLNNQSPGSNTTCVYITYPLLYKVTSNEQIEHCKQLIIEYNKSILEQGLISVKK